MSGKGRRRAGVTLIELVVALAIVGVSSGVVLLAWRSNEPEEDAENHSFAELIANTRRRAITSGRTQQVSFRIASDGSVLETDDLHAGSSLHAMAVYPDGSVVAAPGLRVDRVAGHLASLRTEAP